MASRTLKLTGKAHYARPWLGQIDREYEDPDNGRGGNWKVGLSLDEPSLKLFNALGAKAKVQDAKDGTPNVLNLRRYEYANYGKGPEALGPPKVTGVEEGTAIGNDSTLTATIEAYPYTFKNRPGVAIRLLSVHVDNHVEYIKSDVPFDADNTPPVH